MSERMEIEIRQGNERDEALVYSTWLRGAKRGTYEAKRIRDAVYYARRHTLIEQILQRGGRVLVAHPSGDPDTVLGYLVLEDGGPDPILHFLYVKLPWRRLGIATQLIEHACPDPNRARFTTWTVWHLSLPAPRGVDRGDKRSMRDARARAIREAEEGGQAGGDTDCLLRKWPGAQYDPDLRWLGPAGLDATTKAA